MNNQQILHSLTNVDDAFILEAAPVTSQAKRTIRGWKLVAVCAAAIAMLAVTVAAASGVFLTITNKVFHNGDTGYSLDADYPRVSTDEFDASAKVYEDIQKEMASPSDSTWVDLEEGLYSYEVTFSTLQEAKDYLGLDTIILPAAEGIDFHNISNFVTFMETGRIREAFLDASYATDDYFVFYHAMIFTELYPQDPRIVAVSPNSYVHTESVFTTVNGHSCHIITWEANNGYTNCDAWVVVDGILYTIVLHNRTGASNHLEIVQDWANQF
jgi:hypothetical protein